MDYPAVPAILAQPQLKTADLSTLEVDTQLRLFAWMQLSRQTDNRILELFRQDLADRVI